MQDDVSANLSMPLLMPAQAQKHVTHNEALLVLDALVQLTVLDRDLAFPPSEPIAGQRHIVPAGAGALWGGPDHAVAVFDGVAWQFHPPQPGWRAFVLAEDGEVIWQEGGWQGAGNRDLMVGGLGVNATPDATNRLAVASDAVLLSHAGAGHQLKINKAGQGETASLLYQSNWTGHAEMGLAGTDDFVLKVSSDGTVWTEALRAEGATGRLVASQGLTLSSTLTGTAVTQGDTDTTFGRLLKTGDYGYGRDIAGRVAPANNLNDAVTGGWWDVNSSTTNRPAGMNNGAVQTIRRGINRAVQIATTIQNNIEPALFIRVQSGDGSVWSPWRPLLPESGTNGNGQFVRHADGTQICVHTLTVNSAIGTAFLGGFRSAGQSWTYPAAFTATPVITATPGTLTSAGIVTLGATGTAVSVCHTAFAAQASTVRTAQLHAIGRWF